MFYHTIPLFLKIITYLCKDRLFLWKTAKFIEFNQIESCISSELPAEPAQEKQQ